MWEHCYQCSDWHHNNKIDKLPAALKIISPFPRQRDCLSYTLSFGFIATVKLQQREFPSYVTNLYVSKLNISPLTLGITLDLLDESLGLVCPHSWPQPPPVDRPTLCIASPPSTQDLRSFFWWGRRDLDRVHCSVTCVPLTELQFHSIMSCLLVRKQLLKGSWRYFWPSRTSWQSTRVVLVWGTECNSMYHWTEQNWTEQNKRCVYYLVCILKHISTAQWFVASTSNITA